MDQIPTSFLFLILFILLCLSAFFSSTETALMSVNRYRLRHLAKKGHRAAKLTERLLMRPDRLIGIILIGNNVVNVGATMLTTLIGFRLGGEAGAAIAAGILILVVLVFAEVTPKTLAALHPEKIGLPSAFIYYPLLRVLWPMVSLLNFLTNGLIRLLGVKTDRLNLHKLGRDELRTIVHEFGGEVSKRHQQMMLGVLDLESVTVEDIMIPRNEVQGIDLQDEWPQIIEQIQRSRHTWLPVFNDDIDHILGMLHLRTLIRDMSRNTLDRDILVEQLHPTYFIPEVTPLNTQLMEFQRNHKRIGLVVDEYGDIQGLVTLEDLLEEIVGEFNQNTTSFQEQVVIEDEKSFLVQGTANLRDLNKSQHWKLPTHGAKTLNGLIIEKLEKFPKTGQKLTINNYELEIVHAKANTIRTVRIIEKPAKNSELV